mmetsp:Transcript_19565/g.24699  ORF Transcript_19565/g.24699 Transcript_19565/m.24699 type:complete len:356 (-) Transcript_19565:2201-3268(-)
MTEAFTFAQGEQPNKLIISWSTATGNGWKASKDIEKGEVLFVERPLALGLFTDQSLSYCGCCFASLRDQSPEQIRSCDACFSFALCKSCETNEESWNAHQSICEVLIQNWSEDDQDESAFARIFLHSLSSSSSSLIKAPNESNCLQGDKKMILGLIVNEQGINTEVTDAIKHWCSRITSKLIQNARFQEQFTGISDFDSDSLPAKLPAFFKKLVYNWHAIPADNIDDDDIGYAIYPYACYFNHSCSPNVSWKIDRVKGALFYATAIRDIKEGEDVLISYFGDDQKVSTNRRKDYLREYYQFDCDCDRCRNAKDCYLCEAESKYLCSRCKGIKYCSTQCQRRHWRAHKKDCAPVAS